MHRRHLKVLQALFKHPVSGNIHLKDVEALFEDLGAHMERSSHGRLLVKLHGHESGFHASGHTLAPDEARRVRKFLEDAGVQPPEHQH
ncbi:MAG: hexulose-6-phosphate synthase [Geminicoccaceae bacterium]